MDIMDMQSSDTYCEEIFFDFHFSFDRFKKYIWSIKAEHGGRGEYLAECRENENRSFEQVENEIVKIYGKGYLDVLYEAPEVGCETMGIIYAFRIRNEEDFKISDRVAGDFYFVQPENFFIQSTKSKKRTPSEQLVNCTSFSDLRKTAALISNKKEDEIGEDNICFLPYNAQPKVDF